MSGSSSVQLPAALQLVAQLCSLPPPNAQRNDCVSLVCYFPGHGGWRQAVGAKRGVISCMLLSFTCIGCVLSSSSIS